MYISLPICAYAHGHMVIYTIASIELSWEEVRHVITTYGFDITKEEMRDCAYNRNQVSALYITQAHIQ
jgi:N2227-like protein